MQQLDLFPDDIRVERLDPEANMYRFYRMRLLPDLFGGVSLIREWGRLGTQGASPHDMHRTFAPLPLPCFQGFGGWCIGHDICTMGGLPSFPASATSPKTARETDVCFSWNGANI